MECPPPVVMETLSAQYLAAQPTTAKNNNNILAPAGDRDNPSTKASHTDSQYWEASYTSCVCLLFLFLCEEVLEQEIVLEQGGLEIVQDSDHHLTREAL